MGIRFDGLSTGLDTTALIDSFLALERRPLELAESRQSDLQAEQQLFRDLNSRLLSLREAALAIDNRNSLQTGPTLDEEFLAYTATSGDPAHLEAEATQGASPGEIDVRIDQVAQAGREISNGFADPAAIVASAGQTLQIDVGGSLLVDFVVGAGGASLEDIRAAINTDVNNDGSLNAQVLFDGTTHRLIVSSNRPGAANAVTVTTDIDGPAGAGSPLFDAALAESAQDAQLQVFGLTVTRDSNEITDVIPGVTLRLARAHDAGDPADSTTIGVTRDDETITASVQAFVDAYNEVNDFIQEQSSYDPVAEVAGPLLGDSTLFRLQLSIQRAITDTYEIGTNPFKSLGQIGVSIDRDGRLSLDAAKLETALDDDALAVREMLMGDGAPLDAEGNPTGIEGAATSIGRMLEGLTRAGDGDDPATAGTIFTRIESYDPRIEELGRTIESMERRLERREELLLLQFSNLEALAASLQSQGSYLSSAFAQLNNGS